MPLSNLKPSFLTDVDLLADAELCDNFS